MYISIYISVYVCIYMCIRHEHKRGEHGEGRSAFGGNATLTERVLIAVCVYTLARDALGRREKEIRGIYLLVFQIHMEFNGRMGRRERGRGSGCGIAA
jgi:hypothetical protein